MIMIVAVCDTDVVNRIAGETKAVKNGMLSIRCATLCSAGSLKHILVNNVSTIKSMKSHHHVVHSSPPPHSTPPVSCRMSPICENGADMRHVETP